MIASRSQVLVAANLADVIGDMGQAGPPSFDERCRQRTWDLFHDVAWTPERPPPGIHMKVLTGPLVGQGLVALREQLRPFIGQELLSCQVRRMGGRLAREETVALDWDTNDYYDSVGSITTPYWQTLFGAGHSALACGYAWRLAAVWAIPSPA